MNIANKIREAIELIPFDPTILVENGFVSLSKLGSLVGITQDEAVLAMALRKHSDFVLDDFGKALQVNLTSPSHCLYVQGKVSHKHLQETLTGIKSVYIPPHSQTVSQKYGFVTFNRDYDVQVALEQIKSVPLTRGNFAVSDLRVMTYQEWLDLTMEYSQLLSKESNDLETMLSGHQDHPQSEGIVATFSGIHARTRLKVLKKLFGLVSPIQFIEWETGQTTGIVRFKSAHGAHLAATYFDQEYIVQGFPEDTGTLLTLDEYQKALETRHIPCIELRILGGSAEQEYWKYRSPQSVLEESLEEVKLLRPRKLKKKSTHLTFDSEESFSLDTSTMDTPMEVEPTERKKRHRVRDREAPVKRSRNENESINEINSSSIDQ